MRYWLIVLQCFSLSFLSACSSSSSDPEVQSSDRKPQLKVWADELLRPSYSQITAGAEEFSIKSSALCLTKTADKLSDLKQSWLALTQSHARVEFYQLGPFTEFSEEFNFWPARPASIDRYIAAKDFTAPTLLSGSVLIKSFSAVEYLLYSKLEEEFLQDLKQTDLCEYLINWSSYLLESSRELEAQWSPEAGLYYQAFVDAGSNMSEFSRQKIPFDIMVNAITQGLQTVERRKLNQALTPKTDGSLRLREVESPYGSYSLALIRANIEGLGLALFGKTADEPLKEGLYTVVRDQSPEIAQDIKDRFSDIQGKLDDIEGNSLALVLQTKPEELRDLASKVNELLELMATDVASLLNVTINFSDNDGD